MLMDLLQPYITDPNMQKQVKEMLETEYYGFTLPQLSAMSMTVTTGFLLFKLFRNTSWNERSIPQKLMDFGMVLLCILLLFVCIYYGLEIGRDYDNAAIGGFAGLFTFWMFFNVIGVIKTRAKAKKDREKLALSLNLTLDKMKPKAAQKK